MAGPATTSSVATSTSVTTTTTTTEPPAPPSVGEPRTDAHVSAGYPGAGPTAFLTDLRTETYDDFTRLVFEFDTSTPEFRIEYVEGPVLASPSGIEVDLEGTAFLSVALAPASGVDLSGEKPVVIYDGPERLTMGSATLTDLVKTEDFESHMTWVLGLDASSVPYSFSTLDDPPRLVIDIHHGGVSP